MRNIRHHNTKGYHQIKTGKTFYQIKRIAKRLNIPFDNKTVKKGNGS